MKKALFQIENDPVFKGYSDGTKWNGFANPYFDLQTAKMVLAYYQNQDCEDSRDQWANWDLTPRKTFEGIDLYYFGGGYIWFELTSLDLLEKLLGDWSEIEGEEVACAYEMMSGLEDNYQRKYKFNWLSKFIDLWDHEEERGKN